MLICRWSTEVLFGYCCVEHWTLGETGDKNQRCQNQIAKIGYYVTGNGQRAVETIFGIGYLGQSIVCGEKTRGVITKFQTRPMTLQRTSTTKCPQWHQIQHQRQQHQCTIIITTTMTTTTMTAQCSPCRHPVGGRCCCSLPSLHHHHASRLRAGVSNRFIVVIVVCVIVVFLAL